MLKQPSLNLLEKIFQKIEKLCKKITKKIFEKFPEIENEVFEVILEDLSKKKETTRETIIAYLECEENYLFTNDADYMDLYHSIKSDLKASNIIKFFKIYIYFFSTHSHSE